MSLEKTENWNPNRYSIINDKSKREIVMLVGTGCTWRKCRFCDYHLDYSADTLSNRKLNLEVLKKVTGVHGVLEVINSGSFMELEESLNDILEISKEKNIKKIEFESHWSRRDEIKPWGDKFESLGIEFSVKIGIESFDYLFRESYLMKGIPDITPEEIREYFEDCCLLFGIPGQTVESMKKDIEIGRKYFRRVCINIMQENKMPIKPDPRVIELFIQNIYPEIKDEVNIDILLENTAFGVGGVTTHE